VTLIDGYLTEKHFTVTGMILGAASLPDAAISMPKLLRATI
jgi:hypothetical protein